MDRLGLTEIPQSYVVNRDLAAIGDKSRSRWVPLRHTFKVTTDGTHGEHHHSQRNETYMDPRINYKKITLSFFFAEVFNIVFVAFCCTKKTMEIKLNVFFMAYAFHL